MGVGVLWVGLRDPPIRIGFAKRMLAKNNRFKVGDAKRKSRHKLSDTRYKLFVRLGVRGNTLATTWLRGASYC